MKSLNIIGRGKNWQYGTTSDREKWIVSSAYFIRPAVTVDKIFQIHAPKAWEQGCHDVKDRLVVAWNHAGFEECERLPHAEIIAEFGELFCSSISWMLGMAYIRGYDDIELHGIDMLNDTEYIGQRDGLFYLMGIMAAKGIKIIIPPYSGIYLQPTRYGIPS